MRKLNMPMSVRMMEKWFAGKLNYSPTDKEERAGLNQDGQPYPSAMIDKTMIKLDWVLGFKRAAEQYAYLISSQIRDAGAQKPLHDNLLPYRDISTITASDICNGDIQVIHKQFQFEYVGVENDFRKKLEQYAYRYLHHHGIPDDLTGALGSFNIYAAIEKVRFVKNYSTGGRIATISSISVYVKDNYTFTDKLGEQSQYLGHWNDRSVILVPNVVAAGLVNMAITDHAVALSGDSRNPKDIYYPVRNSSFRMWQLKHQRGGDFIVYSDRRVIQIDPPIVITLP